MKVIKVERGNHYVVPETQEEYEDLFMSDASMVIRVALCKHYGEEGCNVHGHCAMYLSCQSSGSFGYCRQLEIKILEQDHTSCEVAGQRFKMLVEPGMKEQFAMPSLSVYRLTETLYYTPGGRGYPVPYPSKAYEKYVKNKQRA